MYCTHFNLKKKPFQLSSDNSFLWLGDTHARALGLLKAGIDGSQRLMVLTGDIGTGKTTLIHELCQCLPQTTAVAHVTDPSIELDYLFRSIAQDFGFDALYGEGEEFAPILSAFLNRRHQAREKCLIIIDEAHLIPERFLALLPSWAKVAPDKTLTVILAGQLELHQVMEETLGRSWKEQVDVHAMLFPLEEEQTRDYINRRLELAGAAHSIFTPGAVREVHRYTKGIPRRINIACDQAMIAACAKDMQTVDAQNFHEAVGILELPQVPIAVSQLSPVVPKFRQSVRVLLALAAATILVVVAYISYFRVLSVPPSAATAAHGDLPGAQLKTFQTESYEPVKAQAATLESSKVSLPPSEQMTDKPKRSADMDAFIKEVFIIHKADSMARVPDPSLQPSTHHAPASETPVSVPAHESVRASSAQPEPDAIIDWLIKEKSQ